METAIQTTAQLPQLAHARNPGMPLDLDWVASVQANTSAIERRAATLRRHENPALAVRPRRVFDQLEAEHPRKKSDGLVVVADDQGDEADPRAHPRSAPPASDAVVAQAAIRTATQSDSSPSVLPTVLAFARISMHSQASRANPVCPAGQAPLQRARPSGTPCGCRWKSAACPTRQRAVWPRRRPAASRKPRRTSWATRSCRP